MFPSTSVWISYLSQCPIAYCTAMVVNKVQLFLYIRMCMYVISGTSLTNEHYSLFNQRQCLTSECLCLAINAIVCELHMIVNSKQRWPLSVVWINLNSCQGSGGRPVIRLFHKFNCFSQLVQSSALQYHTDHLATMTSLKCWHWWCRSVVFNVWFQLYVRPLFQGEKRAIWCC